MKKLTGRTFGLMLAAAAFLILAEQENLRILAAETDVPSARTVAHDPRLAEVRALILERVAIDIPSFGIAVVHRGAILWEEVFGWADRAARMPASPDTSYPVASVAKSLTATGVMQLAEQGRLDLDKPLSIYVNSDLVTPLAGSIENASVRDLLTMTAGLPMGFKGIFAPHAVPSRRELLRHHGGLLVFPPGKIFHYSNLSLGLAEIVVEKETGKPFGEAMREILLDPIGMSSTFYSGFAKGKGPVVSTYDEAGSRYPAHTDMPSGGGGAYSSISDLRRYALAHLGHPPEPPAKGSSPILSAAVREAMHSEITEGSGGMFAIGWWVLELGEDVSLVVSDGHGMGSMALVQLVPSEDLAVVCVMNTRKNDPDGKPLTNKVAIRALEAISPGLASKHDRFWEDRARIDKAESVYRPTSSLLGRWSGFVRAFDGSRTSIELLFQQDGDIHVTLEDQYTVLFNEPRYRNGILDASFPGHLLVDVPYDYDHVILARILFDRDQAHGYLNATFDDQRGEYDLSSYLHLERDPSP